MNGIPSKDDETSVDTLSTPKAGISRITQYVPLFISVLALGVSLWSAYATRIHNKLTVRPMVTVALALAGPSSKTAGLSIRNDGFAPALIRNPEIFLDGKKVNDWNSVKELVNSLPGPRISPRWRLLAAESGLRAGEDKYLYMADSEEISEANREPFNKIISERVLFFTRACSVYEECELLCSSSDSCEELFRKYHPGK